MTTEKKKKFLELVSEEKSNFLETLDFLNKNNDWLFESQRIAFKILDYLNQNKMTQKELAEKLEVSPQQVSKIVKGKENLTLETLSNLEKALGIAFLPNSIEKKFEESYKFFNVEKNKKLEKVYIENIVTSRLEVKRKFKKDYNKESSINHVSSF